jgi:hypothetical protein
VIGFFNKNVILKNKAFLILQFFLLESSSFIVYVFFKGIIFLSSVLKYNLLLLKKFFQKIYMFMQHIVFAIKSRIFVLIVYGIKLLNSSTYYNEKEPYVSFRNKNWYSFYINAIMSKFFRIYTLLVKIIYVNLNPRII